MRGKCARYCPFFIRERRTFDGNIARQTLKFAAVSLRFYFVSQAFLGTVFRYLSGGKWVRMSEIWRFYMADIATFILLK